MKEFKIKSPTETFDMINSATKDDLESFRPILDYIDQLDYNINSSNVNVKR